MESVDERISVAALIPAYEPGDRLVKLVEELSASFRRIIVVDDGSRSETAKSVFAKIKPKVEKIIVHSENRGKGAAIKSALNYLGASDVVIADADGQHLPEDIVKVAKAVPGRAGLVLGSRVFRLGETPFRSIWGNWWTQRIFRLATGLSIRDTQTGLRGVPASLVESIAALPGERYEFEMVMLAAARRHREKPLEVAIRTVYFENNRLSHFSPLKDTICIFRALFRYLKEESIKS